MCHRCIPGTQASHSLESSASPAVFLDGGVCYITTVPLHTWLLYPGAGVARTPERRPTHLPGSRTWDARPLPPSHRLATFPASALCAGTLCAELSSAKRWERPGPSSQISGGLRLPFEIALGSNLRESLSACLHLETDLNNISDLSQTFPGDLDRIREQAVDGAGAPWGLRGTCWDLPACFSAHSGHPPPWAPVRSQPEPFPGAGH